MQHASIISYTTLPFEMFGIGNIILCFNSRHRKQLSDKIHKCDNNDCLKSQNNSRNSRKDIKNT